MKYHAKFYGIPCTSNDKDNELQGKTFIYDKLLDFFVQFHLLVIEVGCFLFKDFPEYFPIEIGREINDKE